MKPFSLFLALLLAGCSTPYRATRPHPTPERMQELLNAPVISRAIKPTKFELRVSSPIVFLGSAVRLSCFVPEFLGRGSISLGIVDQQSHISEIQSVQTQLLVDHIDQCGELTAFCVIETAAGVQRDERPIKVQGGLCDSSGN